jgi:hypothetical protein
MSASGVSEIHACPLRPPGFVEPLFPTLSSRKAVAEHLLGEPWLCRASELKGHAGETAHAVEETVELRGACGRVEIVRAWGGRKGSWRRRRVVEVLDRWREVRGWWDEARRTDRLVFRVLLSGDLVVDLARERSGGWAIVGVVD